ncbi:E3 ubiquitin-protein ligase ubr1 [Madurella mycetomatis]|uniref:E3 ubiquitin-protein ligase n=1 Tax=Madurella mycetomatis TaxID=100816 RepID=A0A175W5C6_9PEZI|nr:E3 ubiquitin-protein ligase ubr1 [Madurella mycetomatis]KXX82263.1 E3 ubiquitin-protein ligase ubr1 [Madurella mycetomatis]
MEEPMSTQEQQLCQLLLELPARHNYRYTDDAANELLTALFWCIAGGRADYMNLFFPTGGPARNGTLKLREAQGAVEGAEYTEAARGKACGHIFKQGEASYACRTCSADDTCCLCSKCFDATDHTGHMVRINISPGNSGCCDCGDPEAWKRPMFCTIHSMWEGEAKGKGKAASALPEDLVASTRMTIGRVFDYLCDVISCSPEQLRQTKTVESIEQDERMSRLSSTYCGGDTEPPGEYAVLLWNDEKHTVIDVRDQVARACSTTLATGLAKAYETDGIGRSILMYDQSIEKLIEVANTIERIRVTVTIRSARDTFREQMCGTMIEWLRDISGCSVGEDHHILRQIVCEEMLKPWRKGSPATHAIVGKDGIDDEDLIEREHRESNDLYLQQSIILRQARRVARREALADEASDGEGDDDDDGDNNTPGSDMDEDNGDDDVMMIDAGGDGDDVPMQDWRQDQALEEDEATVAGYPPPPPPPPAPRRTARERELTPSDSDTAEPLIAPTVYAKAHLEVPKTPGLKKGETAPPPKPGHYWLVTPAGYVEQENIPVAENVFERVRLDWMILFDLRMWKKVRNDLRSLYISTVVTIPEFKRVLGLRFAGLYTTLAQLYLIGDREPDHSIINISLQMLTTPSITAEIVERGNFLTSLMAILYTFLTTRQVGHPWDVASNAVLSFDTGSVTNRRMYHFFLDLKYLFGSPHVQERLRTEERYMMQFLDLVKLHQGICPNVRAVGEHVEYETDSWIGASLVTREINRLCRQLAESFRNVREQDSLYVSRAIRMAAKAVIINSIGAERARFTQSEIKDEVRFKMVGDFEFDTSGREMDVVRFVVEEQPISFHHALHYTLSWLIECGKAMPIEQLRALLSFTTQELLMKPRSMGKKVMPKYDEYGPEDYLMAAFDYPLRVCAWLAQMKAGMWVRNGLSLRHQAGTYRGVVQRDVSHQRDIFLLQTALVVCDPSRVLASIVDRFGMEKWVKGIFEQKSKAQDDIQHLDVVEDMIHLLIVLLSDRTSLLPGEDDKGPHIASMRRDLTHVLCFKPMSFSDICQKLPDKFQEQEDFHRILDEMTTFKSPEGLSDVGTFELKPQLIEDVDPYIAHYNKNQREESEMAWRKWMAKKTGKSIEDVVYEPKLKPIPSGVFAGLGEFTRTGMFAQIIYYSLLYTLVYPGLTPQVPSTRVETFLQVVLHLILIAIAEDNSDEDRSDQASFIATALSQQARSNFMPEAPQAKTIVALLNLLSAKDEFKACHAKVATILRRMRQKRPKSFEFSYQRLGLSVDRINTASPAASTVDEERERKKRAALDHHARVMAQFQAQQKSFLENQGDINWGEMDDLEDDEDLPPVEEHRKFWKYPSGTCILCQEDTDDRRLYGTFAFFTQSNILRQTDFQDADFVREAFNTPDNLDRSAENIRPFGVARENRQIVHKVNQAGQTFETERQIIGKGFPANLSRPGPLSIGCGHIMHYSCFEAYFDAIVRRHNQQIARYAPEDTGRLEFVCPLCKALGNGFLPIIWKGQEESYPGPLVPSTMFSSFLDTQLRSAYYTLGATRPPDQIQNAFALYTLHTMVNNLAEKSSQLLDDAWVDLGAQSVSTGTPFSETFSLLSVPDASTPRTSTPDTNSMMRELVTIYRRLRDTLRKNRILSRHQSDVPEQDGDELYGSDALARSVGFSISAIEIQQRGVEAEYGMTFLEKIPDQVLTQLRILSETVTSFIAVGGLRESGENRIDTEYRKDSERQHCQLFIAQYHGEETENTRFPATAYPPLLSEDLFVFLCESVFGVASAQNFEIAHLVRLCYLAEITKVVYHLARNMPATLWIERVLNPHRQDMEPQLANFATFCEAIFKMDVSCTSERFLQVVDQPPQGDHRAFEQPGLDTLEGWYQFVRKYALAFLRKCVILLHVKFGVDFNSRVSPAPEQRELERLTEMLRVPSLDEMLTALTPQQGAQHGWPADTPRLVEGWVWHQAQWPYAGTEEALPPSAVVSHPGIFELVGLPKNYDTLIDECTRRRCPTKGKDITDPTICLFCGDIFCGQAVCCAKDVKEGRQKTIKIGGSQQHMLKCQKNIGLFINIRKCYVIYLSRVSGSFSSAPYMDKYGEVDMGLRYGRQLFLHQKRYDSMLRNLWLSHGVPSFISRKLEADINNGGWETI